MSNIIFRNEYLREDNIHHMNKSLNIEQGHFKVQDEFYRKMGFVDINRQNYDNTPEEREMQRKDIDLFLTTKKGKKFAVSEKYRLNNYGDVLFEIYSVYENKKFGWSIIGKSDGYFYFVNAENNKYKGISYVGAFNTKDMHDLIEKNDILKQITDKDWDYLYKSNYNRISKDLFFHSINETCSCSMIKAKNVNYVTMSISIPYHILDKLGVRYKLYDWEGNELNKNTQTWKR